MISRVKLDKFPNGLRSSSKQEIDLRESSKLFLNKMHLCERMTSTKSVHVGKRPRVLHCPLGFETLRIQQVGLGYWIGFDHRLGTWQGPKDFFPKTSLSPTQIMLSKEHKMAVVKT